MGTSLRKDSNNRGIKVQIDGLRIEVFIGREINRARSDFDLGIGILLLVKICILSYSRLWCLK